MKSFAGRTAAITGAGSGIGRALAVNLAGQGCQLALSDIDAAGLNETFQRVSAFGVKATKARVDVAKRASIYGWAQRVAKDFGTVNLVFNNAGVALGSTVAGMSDEDFEWIMDINFWGVVHGTRAFLPLLKESGDGHVVNISSVFGIAAIPSQSAYNASKFAVRGFTEALRQELELARDPVGATSVHPGGIKTNIAKSARFGADMQAVFGKSDAASKAQFERLFSTTPDTAAKVILDGVRRNRRRVLIGADAHVIDWTVRLMPSLYQPIVTAFTRYAMR
ncbi:MAG: SDR family NAD(P)-dependent oxidoreductase [Nevskia sp.]